MSEFNDPTLKSAIKTLRGKHRATDELRQKIAARLAEGNARSQSESRPAPKRWFRPWIAAAAVLILVAGTVVLYVQRQNDGGEYASSPSNEKVLQGMIGVQEGGAGEIPNQTAVAAAMGDPAGIAVEASGKLSRSVPTVTIADGWTLDAASICDVGKFKALRMHYTRGKEQVAFISLPAAAWHGGHDGNSYKLKIDGHPIAGYIKAGSLNCFVGSTTVTLDEVVKLRDQIRGS